MRTLDLSSGFNGSLAFTDAIEPALESPTTDYFPDVTRLW